EPSDRRTQPEHAITELREHIIHLQKNRFEESDQQKKRKDAREGWLSNEPPEQLSSFGRALPHGLRNPAEQRSGPSLRFRPLVLTATKEVNCREDDELDRQAGHEELLVRCRLKPEKGEVP